MTAHEQDDPNQPTESRSPTPTETVWRSEDDPQRYGALLRLLFEPEPASRRR
jgi:hypothetical protein